MSDVLAREEVFEGSVAFTGLTDFGVGLEQLGAGKVLPPEGVRLDFAFAGPIKGRLSGTFTGVDYMHIRADGRMNVHVHGVIATADGARISVAADGVGTPRANEPRTDLRENWALFSSDARYAWVNAAQIWVRAVADLLEQRITIQAFRA